ncbi:nucleotidyl transferase AbiEii/AbiGii toxin family protein [Patescibacteria group bacterium]|nr:nucleotidyl transferase AbiEii/AbiGii toxin family protein [Patescibacteria group bacterium]MBU1256123.1 nucleotidyl transferase AbiEii/AbiGii toxin family protein [Patescibacteria group bacterium]MBU1457635.1 nucleotidyl transferase AbiEii/AbiGii toxin family protein [Patescibacteria group bacterium]
MLNIDKHKQVLSKILIDLVRQKSLVSKLGFKGGTSLFFFYGLDRFSTDLDFDLITDIKDLDISLIDGAVNKSLDILDKRKKRYTLFWLGSYEKGLQKVKVEINLRKFPNEYEVKDFRGYSVLVMKPEFMFAHKLCAVLDRKNLQNRDLYDIWFMFEKNFSINKDIIKLRLGKGLKEYLGDLLKLVDSLSKDYDILSGLGEVLSKSKKDWVKSKLLIELRAQLASRV